MDVAGNGVEGLWEVIGDISVLVQDVPDAASVAILATTMARPGLHADDGLLHAV